MSPSANAERRSWIAVAAWTAIVYLTIPFARWLEKTVGGVIGQSGLSALGLGAVAAGLGWAAVAIWRRRPQPPSRYAWLAATGAGYAWWATGLSSPVETLHFLQYGVLGALAFRAFGTRFPDRSSYACAAALCALLGTVDEIIQWITPRRYWEFRDVALNAVSAGLAQVAIWKGVAPAWIAAFWGRQGLAVACRCAAALALLLALCAANTPARTAAWAPKIPGLAFLADNPSVMAEYGHRYRDSEIGVFYSRLAPAELERTDRERAREAASIIDRYAGDEAYRAFLEEFPPQRDPFVHEARVHLFRRDRYLEIAAAQRTRGADPEENLTVAWRENLILERYFPATLAASASRLPVAERSRLGAAQEPERRYESAVSAHLITRISLGTATSAGALLAVALLGAARGLHSARHR